MEYSVNYRDASGKRGSTVLIADSETEAEKTLLARGQYAVRIRARSSHERRIPDEKLLRIVQSLHLITAAAMPLADGIKLQADSVSDKQVRRILTAIAADVRSGSTLHRALEKHSVFNGMLVGMVRAGETYGTLAAVLEELSFYIERNIVTKKKIAQATAYPAFLLGLSGIIVTALLVFVIPRFETLLSVFGTGKVPVVTAAVFGLSALLRAYGLIFLAVICVLVIVLVQYSRTAGGAHALTALAMRIGPVRNYRTRIASERFVKTFSMLLSAGATVSDSFAALADALDPFLRAPLMTAKTAIDGGASIHSAIQALPLLDTRIAEITRIGEETGHLADAYRPLGRMFEREVDDELAVITSLLQPVLIAVVGVIVGVVMVSIFAPLFQFAELMK
ncbi:MAG: type II secretion system F family protein [Spirochaetes bacterium]|nr:type II secretion system F family protein [Spirochaetota bacterium]